MNNIKSIEANLKDWARVYKEVKNQAAEGRLPANGNITVLSDADAQFATQRLFNSPDMPDCSDLGRLKYIFFQIIQNEDEQGLKNKLKKQILKHAITEKINRPNVSNLLDSFTPEELKDWGISHFVKKTLGKTGGGYYDFLKGAQKDLENGIKAYEDHFSRCGRFAGAKDLIELGTKEEIGKITYKTPRAHALTAPPVAVLSSTPHISEATAFIEISPEEGADILIDVAGELTGSTLAFNQAKELKIVFTSMFSDPKLAPKLLTRQLISEPEKIFHKIMTSPKEFFENSDALLNDPTLIGALNTVGIVFAVVALANDILPVFNRISRDAFKNPAALPVYISKEILSLTRNKIVALVKTTEGLLTDPIKVVKGMAKGFIKSPKELVRNVKSLLGVGNKKRRRAKRAAQELANLQIVLQRTAELQNEHALQEIIETFPSCYNMAQKQWMIRETMLPEEYFSTLVDDWKKATVAGKFSSNFGQFIRLLYFKLINGHFYGVAYLSPTAHAPYPIPPQIFFDTVEKYVQTNYKLACEAKSFERAAVQFHGTVIKLGTVITTLSNSAELLAAQVEAINLGSSMEEACVKLEQHNQILSTQTAQLKEVGPAAVAARLKNKMTPEMAAKMMATLSDRQ